MSTGFFTWASCALCGSTDFNTLYSNVTDPHYGIQGEYTEVQCTKCSLVFLNPTPSAETLKGLYPQSYYAYQGFTEKPSIAHKVLSAVLQLGRTGDPTFDKPGRMLDIGCGTGECLAKWNARGWETHGVEISEAAACLGQQQGLDVFAGTLHEAKFPDEHFDYVRMNHSLEHIDNPNEVLDEIHRIIKPTGKLFIGVPNIDGLYSKLFKRYWWYLCAPVHPFNYSIGTLTQMLQKHKFKVKRVQFRSDYGGSAGSLQVYLNRNTGKMSNGGKVGSRVAIIVGQTISLAINLCKAGDAIELISCKE